MPMDEHDLRLRNITYALFVELGRAPSLVEVALTSGAEIGEVAASWRRLHDEHALVLNIEGNAIRMANPFSAVPTPFRVEAGGRLWYGNCAWDAFGICAALDTDGGVETSCPDCGKPIALDIRDRRPSDESLFFHCLLPAARWWDDVAFT